MEKIKALLFVVFFVAALLPCGSSSSPAFLWSSHHNGAIHSGAKEIVNYHTLFPRELADLVLSEGGWSTQVCSGEKSKEGVDVALVFLGRKLQSSDLPRSLFVDPSILQVLEASFTKSNFSMAFPYIVKTKSEERMEDSLMNGFSENCGNQFQWKHIAISEACSVNGYDFTKLPDMDSVQEYIRSNGDSRFEGKANVIVYCSGNAGEIEPLQSEGEVLVKLMSFMEKLQVRYSVLYASDPLQQVEYGSQRVPYRALTQSSRNASASSDICDEVCKIKSSLLEGVFVAIVLLIILLSGLCCMMGIDTPSRFETPQDS